MGDRGDWVNWSAVHRARWPGSAGISPAC